MISYLDRLKTAFTVETNVRSGGAAPAGEDIIMPAAAGVVSGDANSGAIFREQSATRIKVIIFFCQKGFVRI